MHRVPSLVLLLLLLAATKGRHNAGLCCGRWRIQVARYDSQGARRNFTSSPSAPASGFRSACSRPHSLTDLKLRRSARANVTVKLAVIAPKEDGKARERELEKEEGGSKRERGRWMQRPARIFQARWDRGNPQRGEEENGRGGGTDTTTYIQAIVLRTVYPGRLRHRSAQSSPDFGARSNLRARAIVHRFDMADIPSTGSQHCFWSLLLSRSRKSRSAFSSIQNSRTGGSIRVFYISEPVPERFFETDRVEFAGLLGCIR